MAHVREARLAGKLRRQAEMRVHAFCARRRAVLIIIVVVILGAAIEVDWALVLIWTAVLQVSR